MQVSNSELATRESIDRMARAAPIRLVDAAAGEPLRILAVETSRQGALAQEGLGVGAIVSVERRLALGGPIILRLGRARLAIARSVAAAILVQPASMEPSQ